MAIDPEDLKKDTFFWTSEKDIQEQARWHLQQLKMFKKYDNYQLNPKTYDISHVPDTEIKKEKPIV